MLKITFTEAGLHLEFLTQLVEDWVTVQAVLAMRTGQRLVMEHCAASLVLHSDLLGLRLLERVALQEGMVLTPCESGWIEVSLRGIWLSSQMEEGVFVAMLSPATEALIFQLWRESQVIPEPMWRIH
jgi:hypothetical protein